MTPVACAPPVLLPGMSAAVRLLDPLFLPAGAVVDTSSCPVILAVPGATAGARLAGGAARVRLNRGRPAVLALRLTGAGFGRCARGKDRVVRALTVTARGSTRVSVRGRFGTARGRRARWTTEDRCGGTLTRVRAGRVAVVARAGARIARRGRPVFVRARGA